jgi:hypothetical protein
VAKAGFFVCASAGTICWSRGGNHRSDGNRLNKATTILLLLTEHPAQLDFQGRSGIIDRR